MQSCRFHALPNRVTLGAAWFLSGCMAWSLDLPAETFSKLSSQEFHVRELAEAELLAWGRQRPESAMSELYRQTQMAADPEARERCLNILRELVTDEYLKNGEGYIGVGLIDDLANVPGEPAPRNAIRIIQVQPDSPGLHAGIRLNDLIVELDDEIWHENDASRPFREKIRTLKPNTRVNLKVLRNGELLDIKVHLGRRPLMADNLFFNGQNFDPQASERAAKEAYFRQWLSQRKSKK